MQLWWAWPSAMLSEPPQSSSLTKSRATELLKIVSVTFMKLSRKVSWRKDLEKLEYGLTMQVWVLWWDTVCFWMISNWYQLILGICSTYGGIMDWGTEEDCSQSDLEATFPFQSNNFFVIPNKISQHKEIRITTETAHWWDWPRFQ